MSWLGELLPPHLQPLMREAAENIARRRRAEAENTAHTVAERQEEQKEDERGEG